MSHVREPAVAGLFYAADPGELEDTVSLLLGAVKARFAAPRALIAPHAGYAYSGPVAATAYAQLEPLRSTVRRVALLGPSHRVPFRGIALASASEYASPLGNVPIDREATARLRSLPQVTVLDAAHRDEHSLEVHLPFLQRTLEAFELVPLVVGDALPEAVAAVIDLLWDGPETLVVVSSDLSHFLDYGTAVRVDRATTSAIEAKREDIHPEQACGCRPINGLLHLAKGRGLDVHTLDVRNSGDTMGGRDSVVGYGAYFVQ